MRMLFEQIRQLASLSFPLLLAKIGIPARGIIITYFFAKLGTQALAAGALTYSLLMAMITFFLGVLMSSIGVSVAYATGAKNKKEVTQVIQQGLWLGILLSIPAMFILDSIAPLLLLLKQKPSIVDLSVSFAHGLKWIFIPYTIVVAVYKLFTNLKKTLIPMLYSLWGLTVTAIVSYLLAFGKFNFPRLGIAGVGWGMAIAYWSQALLLVLHVSIGKLTSDYRIFKQFSSIKIYYLKKLWKIGWPVGLKYNIEFLLLFGIAAIIGAYYNNQLAVYQVVLQCLMLSSCLSSSVGLGTETLVGQAIGSKNKRIIKPICYAGLILALCYILIPCVLYILFPEPFAQIFFTKNSPEFHLLLQVFSLIVIFQLLDSLRKVLTDILVTFKDSQYPLIAEFIGLWLISLPTSYILGVTVKQQLPGFLIGLIIGLLVSVCMMLLQFRKKLSAFDKTFSCPQISTL